ncbi:HlyD family efflux transporter periplasmic adaptor subunit [Bacillus ndiopicus]|uniref:HlyD family efflux transporter periplasmic adaptor subunit n=1 Tax=Bacillus ndiopicus TaxID=1347368 RepID=UPI0005A8A35A|nr:HlyD family efflux transporter periplasmic adaptor subunit [Bacillus ndiopicus]
MRVKINNLNELTDSREILESKPHPFVPMFISILVVIIIGALIWSYFGEMDVVAKANGIVRPNEKIHTVQAPLFGKIEEVYVKEGQRVELGDTLFSIEQAEVLKELENRKAELEGIKKELTLLNTYKESIQAKKNLFKRSEENRYSELVDQYIVDYNKLQLDFENASIDVEQKRRSLEQSSEIVDVNILENERTLKNETNRYEVEVATLEEKINQLTFDLDNENKLRESIVTSENHLEPSDTVRNAQLIGYQKNKEQLTLAAEDYKKVYDRSLELGERFVSKVQLDKEKTQYENALIELESFENKTLFELDTNIKQLEKQLQQVQADLTNLNKMTDLTVNNEGLHLEKEHLNKNIQSMNNQQGLLNQGEQVALDKFKLDKFVEINNLLEVEENKKKAIEENIERLEIALNNGAITALTTGTINIVKEINVGEFVQSGETILTIIPDNESEYKVMLAVTNQEIGKIRIGDNVNFHFSAFPKQNFGYLTGEITSISSDSSVGENGMSYYSVKASLKTKQLSNKQGEKAEVKVGMTADASVITESKKIIYYLLEKVNFID